MDIYGLDASEFADITTKRIGFHPQRKMVSSLLTFNGAA